MPGPLNKRRRQKQQLKGIKAKNQATAAPTNDTVTNNPDSVQTPTESNVVAVDSRSSEETRVDENMEEVWKDEQPADPCIYNPGNGPRVKDMTPFLLSPFSVPPYLEDELGKEMLSSFPIFRRFLPQELAAILWYNKTRVMHRVCPACRRVYNLGESLLPHLNKALPDTAGPEKTGNEQRLSGICSFPCFALASYKYGAGGALAHGLRSDQLDELTKDTLAGPGAPIDDGGLSMYLNISRMDGLELLDTLAWSIDQVDRAEEMNVDLDSDVD